MEVTKSDRLVNALRTAICEYEPRVVVETGTYLGLGSTRIIVEAFDRHPPEKFYTIEISRNHYEIARRNLAPFEFVEVIWGLSVDRTKAQTFIQSDPLLWEAQRYGIEVENPSDPVSFYLAEMCGGVDETSECFAEPNGIVPDAILEPILSLHRSSFPLIALDSAGGIGWLEFQEVMRLQDGHPFVLFLDDINHVKHYRSMLHIQSDSAFHIIDCDLSGGWLVAVHCSQRPGAVQSATRSIFCVPGGGNVERT